MSPDSFFRPAPLRPDGPRPAPVYAENVSGNRDLVAGGVQGRGMVAYTHRRFRGIEWMGVKLYDHQKVTFSTLVKLYIAGLVC